MDQEVVEWIKKHIVYKKWRENYMLQWLLAPNQKLETSNNHIGMNIQKQDIYYFRPT